MSIGNTSVQTAPNAMRKVPFITPSKCAGESHPQKTLAIFDVCHLISGSTRMSQIASVAREKRHSQSKIHPLRFRATITQGRRSDVQRLSCSISQAVRESSTTSTRLRILATLAPAPRCTLLSAPEPACARQFGQCQKGRARVNDFHAFRRLSSVITMPRPHQPRTMPVAFAACGPAAASTSRRR